MLKKMVSAAVVFTHFLIPFSLAGESYYPVSITQLVATPEKYVNQEVRVKGYLEFGKFLILYPNHLPAEIGDIESGVQVIDQTEEGDLALSCNKKYVVITGRFTEYQKRYEIIDVMEALDAKTLNLCWAKAVKGKGK